MPDHASAVRGLMPQIRADLERLVRIPSIAFPGYPDEPVREAAEATREILRDAGLANAELIDVPDAPAAVYGEIPGPEGAPTVLLYAHYDVQPAGDEAEWDSDPWERVERGGRLYGRGTADDKCGIALHAACVARAGGRPPVNVKVIIEGEEETGRGTFERYVAEHAERFAADLVIVADAGNWKVGEPTLTTSLRGLVSRRRDGLDAARAGPLRAVRRRGARRAGRADAHAGDAARRARRCRGGGPCQQRVERAPGGGRTAARGARG